MPMTAEARNAMLDSRYGTGAASGTWMDLHTGDPTLVAATAVANTAAGGTPAYAPKQVNYNAAAAGAKTIAANLVFDVPAGTYSHYSLWNHQTLRAQANFLGSGTINGGVPLVATVQDTVTVTAATVRAD